MNIVQSTQGGPNPDPDWLAKIESYVNRAADALIGSMKPIAKHLDDLEKSIAERRARKRQ